MKATDLTANELVT